MESRINKYNADGYSQDFSSSSLSTRSSRNANLYREVYGKYGDLDNLPIEDNTNEIDMAKLRELVLNKEDKKEEREIRDNLNILEQRKRRIDEQKLYDINKILEKAKYENSKLKEPVATVSKPKRDILSTLESTELSLEDIKKACGEYRVDNERTLKQEPVQEEKEQELLSMTRELKYKNLEQQAHEQEHEEIVAKEEDNGADLSLDLFDDLKPTGNTIVTKPIVDDAVLEDKPKIEEVKSDFVPKQMIKSDIHSGDTSDIDIIKESSNALTNDFFTSSYEFTKKDFAEDDDDFFDEDKGSGIFKIVLLILAILVFIGVIVYFVGVYGLGLT